MSAWAWLVAALVAGAGSYLAGWPAWSGLRARGQRDLNAERYLAWRGRAGDRPPDPSPTRREQQRLVLAGLLALVAIFCLVGFFTYS
jgi:hypothetical protein